MKFPLVLLAMAQLLKHTARKHPAFRGPGVRQATGVRYQQAVTVRDPQIKVGQALPALPRSQHEAASGEHET